MSPGLLVFSILLAVALIQGLVWSLVIRLSRRRAAAQKGALQAELAAHPEERVLRGPVRARVRRGHVTTPCLAVLTDQRLLLASAQLFSIQLTEINTVKSNTWFNGEYRGGYEWTILTTNDDVQLGLLCLDADAGWPNALREALPQRNSLVAIRASLSDAS